MRPIRRAALLAAVLTASLLVPMTSSFSAPHDDGNQSARTKGDGAPFGGLEYAPGVVLVGINPRVGPAASDELRRAYGVTGSRVIGRGNVGRAERWRLPQGLSVEAAIAQLERDPAIRYAEPDWKVR